MCQVIHDRNVMEQVFFWLAMIIRCGHDLSSQKIVTNQPILKPYASSPHLPTVSLRSILILSSHLLLDLPNRLFPPRFPTKIFHAFFVSPIHAIFLSHPILFDVITLITFGEAYKLRSSHYAVFPNLVTLRPLTPKYSPQRPVLKHSHHGKYKHNIPQ